MPSSSKRTTSRCSACPRARGCGYPPGLPAGAAALYDQAVPGPDLTAARASLGAAGWRALEQAYEALTAGGLPCGAALADAAGAVVACGRNHAYDPLSGDDPLTGVTRRRTAEVSLEHGRAGLLDLEEQRVTRRM